MDNAKDLLEKVKSTARAALDATGKAAQSAGKKAGEIMENTRLNIEIFRINGEIDNEYKQIGRMVYEAHGGSEVSNDEVARRLELIDQKNARIAELRAQQEKTAEQSCGEKACDCDEQQCIFEQAEHESEQQSEPTKKCEFCGKECAESDAFCGGCGQKL